jgi:hypothetical protein
LPRSGSREHDRTWLPWLGPPSRRTCGNSDEFTGVDVRVDGWDIRGRWFGVVVGATPRLGELPRGQAIPWRVIAAQIAPHEHRGSS